MSGVFLFAFLMKEKKSQFHRGVLFYITVLTHFFYYSWLCNSFYCFYSLGHHVGNEMSQIKASVHLQLVGKQNDAATERLHHK